MSLTTLVKGLEILPIRAEELVRKSLQNNPKKVAELNRKQLRAGKDSEGKDIEFQRTRTSPLAENGKYTKAYARSKQKKGGNTSVVDVKDTGKYHRSIKLKKKTKTEYALESQDSKDPFLQKNYGKDILGVTQENLDRYTDEVIVPFIVRGLTKLLTT